MTLDDNRQVDQKSQLPRSSKDESLDVSQAPIVAIIKALDSARQHTSNTALRVYDELDSSRASGRLFIMLGFTLVLIAAAIRTLQWFYYASFVNRASDNQSPADWAQYLNVLDDPMFLTLSGFGAALLFFGLVIQITLVWNVGRTNQMFHQVMLNKIEQLELSGRLTNESVNRSEDDKPIAVESRSKQKV